MGHFPTGGAGGGRNDKNDEHSVATDVHSSPERSGQFIT